MGEESRKNSDIEKYINKYEEMQQSAEPGPPEPEGTGSREKARAEEAGGSSPPGEGSGGARSRADESPEAENSGGEEQDAPAGARPVVERVEFPSLDGIKTSPQEVNIEAFKEIKLPVSAELGKTTVKVRDLINLEKGSLLKLNRLADESISVLVNEVPFAQGEVVVINERFGVRIVNFLGEQEESEKER